MKEGLKVSPLALAFTLLAAGSANLLRADTIVQFNGKKIERVQVRSTSFDQVEYKLAAIPQPQRIPAEEVERIIFESSRELETARSYMLQSAWQKAAEVFGKIAASEQEPYAEAGAFGECEAKAWYYFETGEGASDTKKKFDSYLKSYRPKKGFHVPFALYLAGRVNMLSGNKDGAASMFEELRSMRGYSRRLLADLGKGELQLSNGDSQGAAITFNTVLNQAKRLNYSTLYRMAVGWRGKALIALKDFRRAVEFLEEHFSQSGKELVFDRWNAQASNVLGDAYAQRGDTDGKWEALYRYIWTTVLFRNWRAECAEAFYKACQMAQALGLKSDAERFRRILTSDFAETVWAKKIK